MFDRVGDLAEKMVTGVSRRDFMGRLGQGALGLAAAIGGVLALPTKAHATNNAWCVIYLYNDPGCWYYKSVQGTCPCGATYLTSAKPNCQKYMC
jgi:hypothetical protein